MKLLVDCDDVFDRLTRAPFPQGLPDEGSIEAHLHVCHECRQLAEALRPAVDLLHEAYPNEPGEALPSYHGVARATPVPIAWSVAWQLVAAALMGVVVGAMALGGWWNGNNTAAAGSHSKNGTGNGLATLVSLNLNEVCLPSGFALARESERLRCCTECHSSAAAAKGIDVGRLQLACIACHEPASTRGQ